MPYKLNFWDGYEVIKINVHEIEYVYTIPVYPVPPATEHTDIYKVVVATTYSRTFTARQGTKADCINYMRGFKDMDFIPVAGEERWINSEHIDVDELSEDLADLVPGPVFTDEDYEGFDDD